MVNWQPDGQLAAVVPHGQVVVFADVGDGPAVAVLDPVGGGGSESPVVGPGDDHISDTGLVPIRPAHLPSDRVTVEATIGGAAVEFGDKLAGGGEHDRVKSGKLGQKAKR